MPKKTKRKVESASALARAVQRQGRQLKDLHARVGALEADEEPPEDEEVDEPEAEEEASEEESDSLW